MQSLSLLFRVVFIVQISLYGVLICAGREVWAERLPVWQYTIADGLPNGSVHRIYQDVQGFLWLSTSDGLSRFDGYQFINYGVRDGIAHARLYDAVADRHGQLWLGTNQGISSLLADQEAIRLGKKFLSFRLAPAQLIDANIVNKIAFDHDNRMWCLTDAGLYRSLSTKVVTEQFERVAPLSNADSSVLLIDRKARVWAAAKEQFISVTDGKINKYEVWKEAGATAGFANARWIMGIVEAADGKIFLATQKNLYEFLEPAQPQQAGKWRRLPLELAPAQVIGAFQTAVDGGLWQGTIVTLTLPFLNKIRRAGASTSLCE